MFVSMLASYSCTQIIAGLSLLCIYIYLKANILAVLGQKYFLSVLEFSCEIFKAFFRLSVFVNGKGMETVTPFCPLELCQHVSVRGNVS